MTALITASLMPDALIRQAIALIAQTPDCEPEAGDLARLYEQGGIHFQADLPDRGQASLAGVIRIGPEPLSEGVVSVAATLIHENFHRRQNPLLKTVSFWSGVATGVEPMRRYEAPAYRAALRFLAAVEATFPDLAPFARQEAAATRAAFRHFYGAEL